MDGGGKEKDRVLDGGRKGWRRWMDGQIEKKPMNGQMERDIYG